VEECWWTIEDGSRSSDRHRQSTRRRVRPQLDLRRMVEPASLVDASIYMLHGIAFATHDTDQHIIPIQQQSVSIHSWLLVTGDA
jgi:hypothetical protein